MSFEVLLIRGHNVPKELLEDVCAYIEKDKPHPAGIRFTVHPGKPLALDPNPGFEAISNAIRVFRAQSGTTFKHILLVLDQPTRENWYGAPLALDDGCRYYFTEISDLRNVLEEKTDQFLIPAMAYNIVGCLLLPVMKPGATKPLDFVELAHMETLGCFSDFVPMKRDITRKFSTAFICKECTAKLTNMNEGQTESLSIPFLESFKKLMERIAHDWWLCASVYPAIPPLPVLGTDSIVIECTLVRDEELGRWYGEMRLKQYRAVMKRIPLGDFLNFLRLVGIGRTRNLEPNARFNDLLRNNPNVDALVNSFSEYLNPHAGNLPFAQLVQRSVSDMGRLFKDNFHTEVAAFLSKPWLHSHQLKITKFDDDADFMEIP